MRTSTVAACGVRWTLTNAMLLILVVTGIAGGAAGVGSYCEGLSGSQYKGE